uniref:Uncharacterized protein n=1 Tax=Arundo donax TaxID=35708 RepID=A0A0A9TMZ2_ARUDO
MRFILCFGGRDFSLVSIVNCKFQ